MLNAEQILNANDVEVTNVEVPEWGGEVGIRIMQGKERDKYESICMRKMDKNGKMTTSEGIRTSLLVAVLCDKLGEKLFTPAQVEALNSKSAKLLDRLFKKALEVNGMNEEANAVIEKN
jgi:hypothetical protein